MPDVKVVVFDIGKALLGYDDSIVVARVAGFSGKKISAVQKMIFGDGRPDPNSIAYLLDSTPGTPEEVESIIFPVIRERLALPGPQEISDQRIREVFLNCFHLDRRTRSLLYYLRYGTLALEPHKESIAAKAKEYTLGILSNNNAIQRAHIESAFPILAARSKIFAFRIFSHEVGVMKPEREIFEMAFREASRACARHGHVLRANECLFFDDLEDNVNAAEDFGIRSELVDSTRPYGSIVQGLRLHDIQVPTPEELSAPLKVDFTLHACRCGRERCSDFARHLLQLK